MSLKLGVPERKACVLNRIYSFRSQWADLDPHPAHCPSDRAGVHMAAALKEKLLSQSHFKTFAHMMTFKIYEYIRTA